jgi:hypothetical protein
MEFHTIFHSLEVYFSYAKDSWLVYKQTVSFSWSQIQASPYFLVTRVQGMSDLLSPILYVMEDESEAFWCFAALMERMAPNFHRDQNGMHSQLLAISKVFVTGLICWWRTSSLFLRMYCRSSSLSCQLNVNINSFAFSWPWRVLRYVIVSFPLRIEYFCRHTLGSFFFSMIAVSS